MAMAIGGISTAGAQELGTLEQPIFTVNPYGATDNSFECIHPETGWQGGACYAPDRKHWEIVMCGWDASNGGSPFERGVIVDAVIFFANFMNERGWDIATDVDSEEARNHELNLCLADTPADVNCCHGLTNDLDSMIRVSGSNETDPASLSFNFIDTTPPPFGDLECSDTSAGAFCQYDGPQKATIKMGAVLTSCPAYTAATPNQQAMFLTNLILHELFHAVGLGHTNGGGLMSGQNVCPLGSELTHPFYRQIVKPNDDQLFQLQVYNPNGNTAGPVLVP